MIQTIEQLKKQPVPKLELESQFELFCSCLADRILLSIVIKAYTHYTYEPLVNDEFEGSSSITLLYKNYYPTNDMLDRINELVEKRVSKKIADMVMDKRKLKIIYDDSSVLANFEFTNLDLSYWDSIETAFSKVYFSYQIKSTFKA